MTETYQNNGSLQKYRVIPWFSDNGDSTLRLNYDLNKDSIVFDLGGYEGQWTSEIFSKYSCNIYVFEPVTEYAANIANRFEANNKIHVHPFGLSNQSCTTRISVSDNASSIYKNSGENQEIRLVNATDFFRENDIRQIDLMKINIEGGEYDLLESLIASDFISNINNIQVQFHDFVPESEKKMLNIQEHLHKTHYLTYQYEFVWENWKKKQEIKDLNASKALVNTLYDQLNENMNKSKQYQRDLVSLRYKLETPKIVRFLAKLRLILKTKLTF